MMEMIDQMNQEVRVSFMFNEDIARGRQAPTSQPSSLSTTGQYQPIDIRYTPSASRTIADQPANVDVAEDKLPSEDNTSSSEEDEPEGHDAGDDDDQGPPGGGQTAEQQAPQPPQGGPQGGPFVIPTPEAKRGPGRPRSKEPEKEPGIRGRPRSISRLPASDERLETLQALIQDHRNPLHLHIKDRYHANQHQKHNKHHHHTNQGPPPGPPPSEQ
jgi:hypothetical protein